MHNTVPYVVGSETSQEAANSMRGSTQNLREMIYEEIMMAPRGLTCDQVEESLEMKHQTASARIRELVLEERIVARGKRPTRSGRQANVYVGV